MDDNKRKVVLLDGHSLAYRAFFALPGSMTTMSGQPTNAVYGFTSMLLKVLDEQKPDAVVVAFDGPRAELKRMEDYPEYKANRPSMPDELRSQMGLIENMLDTMRIPRIQITGYEADDIIGTVAERVAEGGDLAVIVTGDKDTLQLVREGVVVVMTGKGISETKLYDVDSVIERYGVPPEKLPEVAGLKGDSSDNIPGVPGIGEKGALTLIGEYGSIDELYRHLEEVSGKRRKTLEQNREIAYLSRKLAVIDKSVPVELDPGEVSFGEWDTGEVIGRLEELEFKTLAGRFAELFCGEEDLSKTGGGEEIKYNMVDGRSAEESSAFAEEVISTGEVSMCARVSGSGYCDLRLCALAMASREKVMVARFDGESYPAVEAAEKILDSETRKSFQDAKSVLESLHKRGIKVSDAVFDAGLAAYLENPSLSKYDLWSTWERHLGGSVTIEGRAHEIREQESLLIEQDEEDFVLSVEAARVYHLKPVLEERLRDLEMIDLFREVEMPLLDVLCEMEETGVSLDESVFDALSGEADEVIEGLREEIFEIAGHEFKLNSPKQLANVLFEEMGIEPLKRTKTGFSTDSSVLESLAEEHPIAGKVLKYREYAKLKSTYYDVLPALVCPDTGRVHCTFNQTVTATGRISSSSPNLQNIPIRTETGKRIRRGFVPGEEGWKMIVADYSQIELRVLAHMSGDENLVRAFLEDEDIHSQTAAELFGVGAAEVTSEMRRIAKMVNFGVVYGMGRYGLATRLRISNEEADRFIGRYFERYPGVSEYRERCIAKAVEKGFAETIMGRRRYIPQLKSGNRQTLEFGERLAVNTPIQGSAADIIKKAMVDVRRLLEEAGMRSRMTMQIHDELVFDCPPDEVEKALQMVLSSMGGVLELCVPLKIDIAVCDNWGQAK